MNSQQQEDKIAELEKKVKKLEFVSFVHLAIVVFGIAGITTFINTTFKKITK
jgi:nitrate reductase NapE component